MIPVRLQISGFLSYNEKVDLDFGDFDLACISGANGAGKSSLLDAITWVLFGEARRRDDAIINHRADTAEVIFDFDYETARYRIQRSKTRDKTTLLEFFIQDYAGSWKALTEATMRATEERIRNSLRLDYETFTNASFFLQGKADQFAQQRPGDRKRILSSILGLEIWESYKEETAHQRRAFETDLNVIDGILTEIDTELKEEKERKSRLADLEKDHATKKELYEARKTLLDQQRLIADRVAHERRQIDKQDSEIQRLRNELDTSNTNLLQRQEERNFYRQQIENTDTILNEVKEWEEARKSLENWNKIAANFHEYDNMRQSPLVKIEGERAKLQTELEALNKECAKMQTLGENLPALTLLVEEYERAIKSLNDRLESRAQLEVDLRDLQEEKSRAKAENNAYKVEMDELKQRIARLDETKGAKCPTCEKPLNSAERHRLMDELNIRGKEKGDAFRSNQTVIEHCDTQYREKETELQALQRVEADLKLQQRLYDSKSEELRKSQVELDNWKKNGLKRMELLENTLKKDDYALESRAELKEIDDNLKKLGYDAAAHEQVRKAEMEGRASQEKFTLLEKAKAALVPLEREIENLEKSIEKSESHLAALVKEFEADKAKLAEEMQGLPDITKLEIEYFDIQEAVNNALRNVGYARNQVDVLDKQRTQKAVKLEEKENLTEQVSNLKILEKAFGKDGIPALLIEQALPEIESHANEILDRLSVGGMSVKFETQREFKDKKREGRRETLDILIRDSAGERAYELFSGGEAFRVNFAIRLALSRVLAHRAGARLQTLVIDEGFGSQDADGRQRLIEAINLVRTDFAKVLVITHLEELKDAFSARIEVTKTPSGSQVQVVAA